ncbi:MAG TPA: TIGR02444 family protein [Caulobacteraceae bacterium]|jgi:uncharacterized protein (TIGR02444 family)|nr:TIGR02444 family protein [Caulobacteraceae bacterium]
MSAWDWLVQAHGAPGVEGVCLALQDGHGQCVSFLLWRAWAACEGRAVSDAELARAATLARAWEANVSAPVRAVRRRLKSPLDGVREEARLAYRQGLFAQELGAEKVLVDALEAMTPAPAGPRQDALAALAQAAQVYGPGAPLDLLEKLAGAC